MRRIFPLALVSLLASIVPMSVQAAPTPVDACREDCTGLEANDGAVKAGRDPVNVILYAHFDSLLGWGSLNTQRPVPEEEMGDAGLGHTLPTIETNTGVCAPATATCMDTHFANNKVTLTLGGPTLVMEDGTWWSSSHQGIAATPEFSGKPLRLVWYMSADSTPTGHGVGAVADLRLTARLDADAHRADPRLIAASAPSNALTATPIVALPTGRTVYEFSVDLGLVGNAEDKIGRGDILQLTVEWEQVKVGNVAEFVQRDWRVHSGPRYLPRLIVPLVEPVRVVEQDISPYDGKLFLRWHFLPTLGDYDIRDESVRLEVVSAPSTAKPLIDHIGIKRSINCGSPSDPVKSTWAIAYRDEVLPDGYYLLRASVLNRQGTYVASSLFRFNVTGGAPDSAVVFTGEASVPGPGLPALLGLVGLSVIALRRRGGV